MYQIRMSSSLLHTFLLCPKRYFCEQLLKMEQKENVYGILGSAVHTVAKTLVEEYFPCENNDLIVKSMRKFVIGNWRNIFLGTLHKAINLLDISAKEIGRLLNEGYPILQNFVSMIADQNLMIYEPVLIEQRFELPILGGTVLLTGIVDLCLKDRRKYRIIDWKTQRTIPKIDDKEKVSYQLELYAFHVAWKFKKPVIMAEYWFLRHKEIHNYEFTKLDFRLMLEKVKDVRDEILKADFEINNSVESCKYCAVGKRLCKKIIK